MKTKKETHTRVGIGIMIFKDRKILLGKRKGSHGAGQYSFPGEHLEYMESFEKCALREIAEECGIKIKNLRFQYLANIKDYAPRHYVHIGLVADWKSGEPKVLEPEKCEGWNWYDLKKLPKPLFATIPFAIKSYTKNIHYKDAK